MTQSFRVGSRSWAMLKAWSIVFTSLMALTRSTEPTLIQPSSSSVLPGRS